MNKIISKMVAGATSFAFVIALQIAPMQAAMATGTDGAPSLQNSSATTAETPEPTPTPSSTPEPTPTPTVTPEPTPTPSDTVLDTTPPASQGPTQPTGDTARTYTYNPNTGMWENDHYVWNPATGQTSPKDPLNYSYNPATGMWDTTEWIYDAPSGKYVENVVSAATPSLQVVDSPQPLSLGSGDNAAKDANKITVSSSSDHTFDLFYNATISNNITGIATSGNASVLNNTNGGSAITGSAADIAHVFNTLNSYWGFLTANPTVYTANVVGDVTGDMLIDPGKIASSTESVTSSNVVVNTVNNAAINNNINLDAKSGDATVASNTNAGNAASGDASAILNLVNMLNSSIGAGQSFIGIVNIYGNLNGDILMPKGFLENLLADNSSSQRSPVINTSVTSNLKADLTNNQAINNNLDLNATSGSAAVTGNTNAGNAKTGSAQTNLTLLNLTGREVSAKDALVVFVNVLGNWVGLIMNAPVGTTSGLASGGVNKDITLTSKADINSTNNSQINNNVSLNSTSGNALVTHNTNAKNATSGDAYASANILNISNSSFSLSDWFGILFINVFGNWHGSFGINTAAGNPINTPKADGKAGTRVFVFMPRTSSSTHNSSTNNTTAYGSSSPLATNTAGALNDSGMMDSQNNSTYILGSDSNDPKTSGSNPITLTKVLGILAVTLFAISFIAVVPRRRYLT